MDDHQRHGHKSRYGDDGQLRRMQTENFSSLSRSSHRRFWDTVMTSDSPAHPHSSSQHAHPTTQQPYPQPQPPMPRMDSASPRHYNSFHVPSVGGEVRRKDFQCSTCKVAFSQKSHLTQHVKTVHEKIRPYKCESCPRAFGKRYDLISHVDAVHKKERPHACKYCDKQFAKRSNLTRHVEHMHPDKKAMRS